MQVVASRPLQWFAYQWVNAEKAGLHSHMDALMQLKAWGFPVNDSVARISTQDLPALFERLHLRHAQPYDMDGWVLKVDDMRQYAALGSTRKAPRWAVAIKDQSRAVLSTLTSVVFQVGRSGVLTPVGMVEPVEVAGVCVTSMSLHNMDEIQRLDVAIGDRIWIKRAGDVIPKCVSVFERHAERQRIEAPEYCPSCHAPLFREKSLIRCTQAQACAAQICAALEHAASREALNIEGLGPKLIACLYERVKLRHIAEVFMLSDAQWLSAERVGLKKLAQLKQSLQRAQETSLSRAIFALGIEHVGLGNAEALSQVVTSIAALASLSMDDLKAVPGIGEVNALAIRRFFEDPIAAQRAEMLERVLRYGRSSLEVREGRCLGWVVVITGRFSVPRAQVEALLKAEGAKVLNAITRRVTHCLVGEEPGRTLEKAQAYQCTILHESAWRAYMEA